MSSTHHDNVATIFGIVLELTSSVDREAYLANACAGNPELRRRIDELLLHHNDAGEFLEQPVMVLVSESAVGQEIGAMIGPYQLREMLGEGGMGIVYVAEQEKPLRRKVALKIVKPGMDTREVIARFEAERQALALMDHPHIAKVHDAGTTETGRPYFVMELVRGLPITEYCDQRRLSPRDRLTLFMKVCQAIQHAHQRGIIHRDLKPSNVMITLHDGVPVPKVIDFGVAKALNQKLTDRTLYTQHAQMVGTPLYMSPEQAELSGTELDARSDVYSLGVMLYELLTGRTPIEKEAFSKVGLDEMRRVIREDEPSPPSKRISTLEAATRSTIAQQRGIEERHLRSTLRGELDWIVMKALEKDRTRRYGTTDALAADLQCYLDDKPVQACPPSMLYRTRKFIRRQWKTIELIAILILCLPLAAYGVFKYFSAPHPPTSDTPSSSTTESTQKIARAPGYYLTGLVPEPSLIPDAGRWQLITKAPRGVLRSASYSPDESRIAVAETNYVRIYDAASLQLLHVLAGHNQPVTSVAWRPDGQALASSSEDRTVRLWSLKGAPTHLLTGHTETVYMVNWRQDGEQLASASVDGTVRLWKPDGTSIRVIDEGDRHVFACGYSPTGTLIATAGGSIHSTQAGNDPGDNSIRAWDTNTGDLIHELKGNVRYAALCLDWRPDGKQIAVGYGNFYRSTQNILVDRTPLPNAGFRLWNIDGTPGPDIGTEFGSISSIAWNPDGNRLAFGGRDGAVRLWNSKDQTVGNTSTDHRVDLNTIRWSQNGSHLLTTSREAVLDWDGRVAPVKLIAGLLEGRIGFSTVKWSPEGDRVCGVVNQARKNFLTAEGTPIDAPPSHTGNTLAWWDKPNGTYHPDGTNAPKLEGPVPGMREWAWSQNGWLAGASWSDASVRIWNNEGKLVAALKDHKGGVESVSWSPDGQWLASGGGDSVRLWQSDGTPGPVMKDHTDEVYPVEWSPDGKWIASAGSDSTIRLWKPDGSPGPVFKGHQGGIHDVAWSPDSKRIASASWLDNTLRVWDVETGQTLWQSLLLNRNSAVTLSPSGQPIAGDIKAAQSEMCYATEQLDGTMQFVPFDEFRERFAAQFVEFHVNRFEKDLLTGTAERISGIFQEALTFESFAKMEQKRQIAEIGAKVFVQQFIHNRYSAANQTMRQVIGVRQRLMDGNPENEEFKNDYALCLAILGNLFRAEGKFTEAREWYSKYLEIKQSLLEKYPESERYRMNRVVLYLIRSYCNPDLDSALRDVDRGLEFVGDLKLPQLGGYIVERIDELLRHPRAATLSGEELANVIRDDVELAKAIYKRIEQANLIGRPDHVSAVLSVLPTSLREPEYALSLARRGLELKPDHHWAKQTVGWALFRTGDWQASVEVLEKCDSSAEVGYFLSMAHWHLGHRDKAREIFNQHDVEFDKYVASFEKNAIAESTVIPIIPTPAMLRLMRAEAYELLNGGEQQATPQETPPTEPAP